MCASQNATYPKARGVAFVPRVLLAVVFPFALVFLSGGCVHSLLSDGGSRGARVEDTDLHGVTEPTVIN